MASILTEKTCGDCPKGPGQVTCCGCDRWFCMKHLLEHRQELSQRMEAVTLERDQLHQNVTNKTPCHLFSLLTRVNRWESRSIEGIKRVANEVRLELEKTLDDVDKTIGGALRQISQELQEQRQTDRYTEIELNKWMRQLKELRKQLEKPTKIEMMYDQDEETSTRIPLIQLRIVQRTQGRDVASQSTDERKRSVARRTVAGGHGPGDALNQLHSPIGLDIDFDGSVFIADMINHRIVRWEPNARQGEIIAGGSGPGNRTDQLNTPIAMLIDPINRTLIISEFGNRRVMRWLLNESERRAGEGKVIISNIHAYGLALDNEGLLYVSDSEKDEVRRYGRKDGRDGVVVAGGHGRGAALNQLNRPRHICVDADCSIYISDSWNHRVVKWTKDAREGVVVAGGRVPGNALGQLFGPGGIFVDRTASVYVADEGNDRVMRWVKDAKEGEVLVGGSRRGSQNNRLDQPASIAVDHRGSLYVADLDNNRVQRFDLR